MKYLFILLISLPIIVVSQNSTKVFENVIKQIVIEKKIQEQLVMEKAGSQSYFVLLIDSLYEVDIHREIRIGNKETLFIYPEDELFFFINKRWLIFEKFEINKSKVMANIKILHSFNGLTTLPLRAKFIFKKVNGEWLMKKKKYTNN